MKQIQSSLEENKRLEWIDVARGLAIFGIFIVNVPAFNAPFFLHGGGEQYWTSGIDQFVQSIIDILFQASFYTLFSFLFGFGMQQIVDRLKEKGLSIYLLIFRRLVVLIGFGLVHAFLIWHGDILLTYGIVGLFMLPFFARRDNTLLYWAFCLLLIPTSLLSWLQFLIKPTEPIDQQGINNSFANYGDGSIVEIWQQNLQDWLLSNGIFAYVILIFMLLPLFLLGMYTARKRWLHDIEKHGSTLKKVWGISLGLFLVFKASPYLFGNPYWFSFTQDAIGGPASAIFYITSIALLYRARKKWLSPLAYVGRMSLSNYISQSIICFLLFYSVGFGLYGNISPWQSVILVCVIYSIQLYVSKLWFRYYLFGPMEWLWRSVMYGKRQPFKRKNKVQNLYSMK